MLHTLDTCHFTFRVAIHKNGVKASMECLAIFIFSGWINVNGIHNRGLSEITSVVITAHELDSVVEGKMLEG
jgi:hypothetical protein